MPDMGKSRHQHQPRDVRVAVLLVADCAAGGEIEGGTAQKSTKNLEYDSLFMLQLEQSIRSDSLVTMLLGKRIENRLLHRLSDDGLRRRVEGVVQRFRIYFPQINYDILWPSRTCNAQAFVLDGKRYVRLYGGLARHKRMTVAGFAWVLAHETGHHVGGAPFHDLQPYLSCEERADQWARTVGLPRLFGRNHARLYTTKGRAALRAIQLTL
jgi:hypothetical protein